MKASVAVLALLVGVLAAGSARAAKDLGDDSEQARTIAYLGVATSTVDPVLARHLKLRPGMGLVVEMVDPKSAAQGMIREEDVLTELDGQLLVNPDQFTTLVRLHKPGEEIQLKLLSEGEVKLLKLKLGEREAPPAPARGGPGWMPDDAFRQMQRQWDMMRRMHGGWPMPGWDDEEDVEPEDDRGMPPGSPTEDEGMASYHASATIEQNGMTATLTESEGQRHFKVTDEKGKVLYDGTADNDADLKKMPAEVRDLYDELAGNVKIRVNPGGAPPHKPKKDKPGHPAGARGIQA